MVRTYKKKTNRTVASPSKLKKGLELIRNGKSLRAAAVECGLNYGCLFRVHKQTKQNENLEIIPKLSQASRAIFTQEQEQALASYCVEMTMIGYGLPTLMVRELAFETAIRNHINMPTSWETEKAAGLDWFHGKFSFSP